MYELSVPSVDKSMAVGDQRTLPELVPLMKTPPGAKGAGTPALLVFVIDNIVLRFFFDVMLRITFRDMRRGVDGRFR